MLARNRSHKCAQHPKNRAGGFPRLCPCHVSPKSRPCAALCTRTRHARVASTLPPSHPDTADTQGAPHRCAADAARAPHTDTERAPRMPHPCAADAARAPHGCHTHSLPKPRASANLAPLTGRAELARTSPREPAQMQGVHPCGRFRRAQPAEHPGTSSRLRMVYLGHRAKRKPKRSQNEAKSKPSRSQVEAKSMPNRSQVEAISRPSRCHIEAISKPNRSRVKGKSKPSRH